MKVKMIPMKGKGWQVTARNLAGEVEPEVSRPLTTDPWDNALLIEEDENGQDDAFDSRGIH